MPDKQNKPIQDKEEIRKNPDNRIDEDFKGYPAGPANEITITPGTANEETVADLDKKDGEKRIIPPDQRGSFDEQESDGSANAFDGK